MIFDDPFQKNEPVLVILVPGLNHQDQLVFWWNEAVEPVEVIEATAVVETVEVLRPTEDFRVNQVLEFSFISMFGNKIYFWRIMKYHVAF